MSGQAPDYRCKLQAERRLFLAKAVVFASSYNKCKVEKKMLIIVHTGEVRTAQKMNGYGTRQFLR